ncbi:MAG: hypothetical protein M3004_03390 [Bacteroidota bacterium]|nr:hypothetical protein [Bacteroidota bacterium]
MKYLIITIIFWFINERTYAQILESRSNSEMIDNIKSVKPKQLAGFNLPAKFLKGTESRNVHDTTKNKYLLPTKKYGTFIYDGKPLKATTLLLNFNGNISSSPIEGIWGTTPVKKRTVIIDTIKPIAKLLYNTDKGKVYALPLDNMRCLVPDEMYSMSLNKVREHYKQYYPNTTIPNALPKYEIIPGKIFEIRITPSIDIHK